MAKAKQQQGHILDRLDHAGHPGPCALMLGEISKIEREGQHRPSAYSAIMSAATPAAFVTVTLSGAQGPRWSVPDPPTDTHFTAGLCSSADRGKRSVPSKRTEYTISAFVSSIDAASPA
ncbi:hypothetical protein OHD62_01630 [Mesorhizobium sp. YC-39]|uniref:hypothetical protein n=1 Tax=unclassified Mesorhizobium TaxID=325217 RepID=UPI0021E858AD|nr:MULTISPECIES: hypothetical protein [unclassified Mesorhizobium]MCV3206542.1 hypothetical protein [Mesorhizobium sp. YC-2]MCV3227058.1 hypothetical protein [Mesorhizobium sp. YC-39]